MDKVRMRLAITEQRSVPTLGLGEQLRHIYTQAFPDCWLSTCSLLSSQHQAAVEMGSVLGACLPAELNKYLEQNGKRGELFHFFR